MAKLMIFTQVFENYGSADTPHWKPKGGSDYVVKNINSRLDARSRARETVATLKSRIEVDNEYYREHIIGFQVVADDYLTEFERSQLEYEGEITYPATELTV